MGAREEEGGIPNQMTITLLTSAKALKSGSSVGYGCSLRLTEEEEQDEEEREGMGWEREDWGN
jgi:hypothetical protein